MAWPLTGNDLSRFTRLLSDLQQYGDFPFVGSPDDITFLQQTIVAASDGALNPPLDDVANRSHYWMLRLIAFLGDQIVPPTQPVGIVWGPDPTTLEMNDDISMLDFTMFDNASVTSLRFNGLETITDGGNGYEWLLGVDDTTLGYSFPDLVTADLLNLDGSSGQISAWSSPKLVSIFRDFNLYDNPLTEFDVSSLQTVGGGFDVVDNVPLVTAEYPSLVSVGQGLPGSTFYAAYQCPNLESVSLPVLQTVMGLTFYDCPLITEIPLPSLQTVVEAFSLQAFPSLTSLDFPSLVSVGNGFDISDSGVASLTAPVLATTGSFGISTSPNLVSVSLPVLTSANNGITIFSCSSLVSASFPSLVSMTGSGLAISSNSSLVTLDISSLVPTNGTFNILTDNAFDAATVNHVLAVFVANPGYTTGQISLEGGTNAAPTGQGIADKATLIGRGVTVTTN